MLRMMFLVLLLWCWPASAADRTLLLEDFEGGLNPAWTVKKFHGETAYRVVGEAEGKCLEAQSSKSASGMVREVRYRLEDYPFLSWRWKVSGILDKGDARRKEGDDYPARVYVIFPHWFPPRTRSINYIWANRLAPGTHIPNPYFSNAIMVAVESGAAKAGTWVEETRDVLADYREIFGEDPPEVGAIAIMTDTDNTGESVRACYDDLRVFR